MKQLARHFHHASSTGAIGTPLGALDDTVSDGLISSVRPLDAQVAVLQISAPISQGSSGGPRFNLFGEVIRVATAVSREGQNLNFAIPVNLPAAALGQSGERAHHRIVQGLLRATSLDGYADKAWALRDAFDGLLDVI